MSDIKEIDKLKQRVQYLQRTMFTIADNLRLIWNSDTINKLRVDNIADNVDSIAENSKEGVQN